MEHFDYVRFGKHLEQDIANMSDSDMLPWGNAETHKPSVLIPVSTSIQSIHDKSLTDFVRAVGRRLS